MVYKLYDQSFWIWKELPNNLYFSAADFKINYPAFGTVLIYKEMAPKARRGCIILYNDLSSLSTSTELSKFKNQVRNLDFENSKGTLRTQVIV